MAVSPKIPLLIISHLALGLIGWWIAAEFRPAATETLENPRTRSNRHRPAKASGDEIIRSIEARLEEAKAAKAKLEAQPGAREKILAAMNGLVIPDDPAATIGKLLATDNDADSIRAAAIFVLWGKAEPAAALMFASTNDEFNEIEGEDDALELVGESIQAELALALPEDRTRDPVLAGLARQLIASQTVEQLANMLTGLEGDLKSSFSYHLGKQWPAERLDDFARLATAMRDARMLDRVSDKLPPKEMASWMMRYVAEHPNAEFARSVTQEGTLFFLLRSQPDLPLEDRLAEVMRRPLYEHQSQEAARKGAMEHLAENDVRAFFHKDGPDLRYAFRHGRIEAPELLGNLSARFPEYAAAGLLPALLHQQLNSADPDRAAYLISDLPPPDQARIIAESAWSISALETLNRVLNHFPDSDDEAVRASRQKFWRAVTDNGLDNYGTDYLLWINRVLGPLDRKMALKAIADRIDGSMESKAAEIRDIVGDIPLRDTP